MSRAQKRAAWILAVAGVACAATTARADIIYVNGGPLPDGGGNEATVWLQAEDFLFAEDERVAGAGVYISGFGGPGAWEGTIEYSIFGDREGTPGAVLGSGRPASFELTDTGVPWCCGGNAHLLEFGFEHAFEAAGGVPYWLAIHLSADYEARHDVYWVATPPNASARGQESEGGTTDNWQTNAEEHAFFLTGPTASVPEPDASSLLLGGLLVGVILTRSGRRRSGPPLD